MQPLCGPSVAGGASAVRSLMWTDCSRAIAARAVGLPPRESCLGQGQDVRSGRRVPDPGCIVGASRRDAAAVQGETDCPDIVRVPGHETSAVRGRYEKRPHGEFAKAYWHTTLQPPASQVYNRESVENPDTGEVTRLLVSWSGGDRWALDKLTPLVYQELHRMAARYLRRERREHTMQPTALIHELYLRLVDQTIATCHTRGQFFAIAANLMRQILVNYAEQHQAAKRGGGNKVILELDQAVGVSGQRHVDLLALNHALNKLAQLDARQSQIVEMRFFGGLTEGEIADVEAFLVTVNRTWRTARAVLYNELRGLN